MSDSSNAYSLLKQLWNDGLPHFKSFIEIPNITPGFETDQSNALKTLALIKSYMNFINLIPSKVTTVHDKDLSPFLLIEFEGNTEITTGFYCHADKQPPLTEKWDDGLDPYKLIEVADKLYGRGTVDDGYAIFLTLNLIKTIKEKQEKVDNFIILIETSEESGSCHLAHYLDKFEKTLAHMNYLFVVDSGGPTYDRLWFTTSFRGCFMGELNIKVAEKTQHSGEVGGVISQPFHIASNIISDVVDSVNGKATTIDSKMGVKYNQLDIKKAKSFVDEMGEKSIVYESIDTIKAHVPISLETYLSKVLYTNVSIIGMNGLPSVAQGGNMIIPEITLKLSIRASPYHTDITKVIKFVTQYFKEKNTYGAMVTFNAGLHCDGWKADNFSEKMETKLDKISFSHFGNKAGYVGAGGSIPIMGLLKKKLPSCKIFATGVLTPDAGAHGPNEFLHIPTLHKFSRCFYDMIISLED